MRIARKGTKALLAITAAALFTAMTPVTATASEVPVEPVEVLPESTPDPAAPAAALDRALATIEGLASDPTHGPIEGLDQVRAHAAHARATFFDGGDLRTVMAAITQALVESDAVRPPDQATADALEHIRNDLAGASYKIALAQVDVGKNAGVDEVILEGAKKKLNEGLEAISSGDHSGGAGKFNDGFGEVNIFLTFDINVFMQNIKNRFEAQTVGYQVSVRQNGVSQGQWAAGKARTGKDGSVAMDVFKPQIIASVSKPITAVAVLTLLEERFPTIESALASPIAPWLPPRWKQGPGIDGVTFEQVLSQRVTFSKSPDTNNPFGLYDTVRAWVADGVTGAVDPDTPGKLRYDYENVNYSLLAILMGRLWDEASDAIDKIKPKDLDEKEKHTIRAWYIKYVNEKIFAPALIGTRKCTDEETKPTKYYSFPAGSKAAGVLFDVDGMPCAHGGWRMSALDLGLFLEELDYGNLVTEQTRALMDARALGWMDPLEWPTIFTGAFGVYQGHGGDLANGSKGMGSCVMNFPLGVQAALIANSRGGNYGDNAYQCTALARAYDGAWVLK